VGFGKLLQNFCSDHENFLSIVDASVTSLV
jgi:hypothetical protein